MSKLRKPIFATAGYYTISLGPGRKEFSPKAPRPGIEHYIEEAGKGSLNQINSAENIDEGVLSNFMMARFNKQGNRPGFIPMIDPALKNKPCTGVEGACASGGLGLTVAIKSILSELADTVLTVGVEVQNSVKPIYGNDILAGAGHFASQRKEGHAYFFPGQFSDRAGTYFEKYGREKAREALAMWYENAVLNARKNPKAQEYHNKTDDLKAIGKTSPNPKVFLENLNPFDCSKISDAGVSIIFASEEGLIKLDVDKKDAVEIVSFGQSQADVTKLPKDLTVLSTTKSAVKKALENADLSIKDIGFFEFHDCFTIGGLIALESIGLAEKGKGYEYIKSGKIKSEGETPINTSGGLIGYGHPVGASGVRQAVDILHQLTNKAGDYQIEIDENRKYGMLISMGGNDRTVVAMIFKKI